MEMANIKAEKQEIEQMLKRMMAAENRHDIEAMLAEMTDAPLLHVCGVPPVKGREAMKQLYGVFFETFVSTVFTPQEIFVCESGEMAWDNGSYVNDLKGPDGPVKEVGKYLGVYHKLDGVWKAAAFCITPNG